MILYIDTLAILYRAYYAIPGLSAKDGTPTGALYGLTNSLFRCIAQLNPEHVVACFDRPEQTLRQESHQEYKANREIPEEDMIIQINAARGMLNSYGVHVVEKAGYEADDLLGTLALRDSNNGREAVIVSCDGDLLQLTVYPGVRVYMPKKGMSDFILYDKKGVETKNEFPAEYIIDFKGLAGDASDNIAGVPGIGPTYAKRLITAFGNLDAIYQALDKGAFAEAGFTKRIEKLLADNREGAFLSRDLATIHTDVPVATPHETAAPWRERIVYADARKTLDHYSFNSFGARLNSITGKSGDDNVHGESDSTHDTTQFIDEDPVVSQEAAVALWVLDATQTNATSDEVRAYTQANSMTEALEILMKKLSETGRMSVWEDIEKPLIPIIAKMEDVGVHFDTESARNLSGKYRKKISTITTKIYKLAGREFNINSPKQLGEVLYTDLNLKTGRRPKTATGGKTTKESVLREMMDDHPIVPLVLEYRHYEKLRSTYTDNLPDFVDSACRIHTHLRQNGTTTGRLSSYNPNLQNIPISGEDGTDIRNLFTAPNGWTMFSIDYSQLELRLAAILSGEKELLRVFEKEGDVHISTAARIFSIPEHSVTSEQRAKAKAINFGILYGMGAQALGKSVGASRQEAEQFLDEYKKAFPDIFVYFDGVKKEASLSGCVTTAFGRVRPIDGITSSLSFIRSQAERIAVNSVVQGTGADIIKLAMIGIDTMLAEEKLESAVRMVLQIHDELLFEVHPDKADYVVPKLVHIMESVYPPNKKPIPLVVSVKQGEAWGSLKPF